MTFTIAVSQNPQHSFNNGGIAATARQYFLRPTQHTPNGPRIGSAVSGMAPGDFVTVWADSADDIFRVHLEETGGGFNGLDWTPRGVWHQGTEQIIIGMRRGSYKLIAYSDITGMWRELEMPADLGRYTNGTAHYYGMIAIDGSGNVYLGETSGLHIFKYDVAANSYTAIADHLTTNGSNGSMLAWDSTNSKLLKYGGDAQRWLIYDPGTDSWANPANTLGNGQHALLEYSPAAERCLLVGGSGTPRKAQLVNPTNGAVTPVTDCPVDVTMAAPDCWIFYHPSGKWIVRSASSLYACTPNEALTDVTWTSLGTSPDSTHTYPTAIADYDRGIAYIVTTTGLYAYKFPSFASANILPAGIASGEAFGTAVVTRTSLAQVSPTGIASEEAFGNASVGVIESFAPDGIASAEAFGVSEFVRTSLQTVTPTGIDSGETFGTAVFSATNVNQIAPSGIASAEMFGSTQVVRTGPSTLTEQDIQNIVNALLRDPRTLTLAKFIALS